MSVFNVFALAHVRFVIYKILTLLLFSDTSKIAVVWVCSCSSVSEVIKEIRIPRTYMESLKSITGEKVQYRAHALDSSVICVTMKISLTYEWVKNVQNLSVFKYVLQIDFLTTSNVIAPYACSICIFPSWWRCKTCHCCPIDNIFDIFAIFSFTRLHR